MDEERDEGFGFRRCVGVAALVRRNQVVFGTQTLNRERLAVVSSSAAFVFFATSPHKRNPTHCFECGVKMSVFSVICGLFFALRVCASRVSGVAAGGPRGGRPGLVRRPSFHRPGWVQ